MAFSRSLGALCGFAVATADQFQREGNEDGRGNAKEQSPCRYGCKGNFGYVNMAHYAA